MKKILKILKKIFSPYNPKISIYKWHEIKNCPGWVRRNGMMNISSQDFQAATKDTKWTVRLNGKTFQYKVIIGKNDSLETFRRKKK